MIHCGKSGFSPRRTRTTCRFRVEQVLAGRRCMVWCKIRGCQNIYVGNWYNKNYFLWGIPTKWHSIWHTFWHSIWHFIWHSIWHSTWHSIWHFSWHSIWHSTWHSIWHFSWHSTWHWDSIWHSAFWSPFSTHAQLHPELATRFGSMPAQTAAELAMPFEIQARWHPQWRQAGRRRG